MMGKLILIRHSVAESPSTMFADSKRALTTKGQSRVKLLRKKLRGLGWLPETVYHSPILRALETSQLLCQRNINSVALNELSVDCELFEGLSGFATEFIGRGGVVALIGHQPYIGILVEQLLGDQAAGISMSAATAICIELDSWEKGKGRLVHYLAGSELDS